MGAAAVWIVIAGTAWWIVFRLRAAARHRRRRLIGESANRNPTTRDYKAFLRAIRDKPGNTLAAASATAFVAALASERGFEYAGAVLGITLVAMATLGFLAWRRWGP